MVPSDAGFFDLDEVPKLLRSVDLRKRLRAGDLVIHNPPESAVRTWRKEYNVMLRRPEPHEPSDADKFESILLELPPAKRARAGKEQHTHDDQRPRMYKREIDPCKWLDAVEFASHLRDARLFSKAMAASKRFDADVPSGSESDKERDHADDPGRTSVQRNLAKLDAVAMALERRFFHAEMATDALVAITVQSDASPVVGAELQGMIVEFINKDGTIRKVTVPGSTLTYGHFDLVHKGVALVWGVWLICGPELAHLHYVFGKVRGVCTDFGVEIGLLDLPDVAEAVIAFAGGRAIADCAPRQIRPQAPACRA